MSAPKSILAGLENCPLHKRVYFGIAGVSQTQFSIAQHYMGCEIQGEHFTYFPETDELIRDDVLKWKKQQEKKP